MKRKSWVLCLNLILCLSVLLPQLNGQQFSYEFTALHNEYKLTNYSIRHSDGKMENCEFTVTYYKLPLKMVFELISDWGYTGKIEAITPDDLFLYDVSCAGKNFVQYCPLFEEDLMFGKICEPVFRRIFMDDNKRAALRQEYEALKNAGLDEAPYFRSPLNDSVQNDPSKVKVELFLARKAVTPCKRWSFTVVFDRWDPNQGSNGKWVSGPHSYTVFQGYENQGSGGGCLAEYYFKFNPGKYRVTARARHKDGRQTPWSHHVEFTVRLNIPKKMVQMPALMITWPKSGQTYKVGGMIEVRWTSHGINQNVKIGLVQGGNIIALTPPGGTPNDGHFRHTIPSDVSPGTYRLGIATMDNSKRNLVDNIIITN